MCLDRTGEPAAAVSDLNDPTSRQAGNAFKSHGIEIQWTSTAPNG